MVLAAPLIKEFIVKLDKAAKSASLSALSTAS